MVILAANRLGLDLDTGHVVDMAAKGIVDSLAIKQSVLELATETACVLLRIDETITRTTSRR
jgi:archaeal chaperonin